MFVLHIAIMYAAWVHMFQKHRHHIYLYLYRVRDEHIFCWNWTECLAVAAVMDFKESRVQDAQRGVIMRKLSEGVQVTRNSLEGCAKNMSIQYNDANTTEIQRNENHRWEDNSTTHVSATLFPYVFDVITFANKKYALWQAPRSSPLFVSKLAIS